MFPYETNATFVRGTCKRHSKYSFLPFGALGEKKKTVLVVESKCLRVTRAGGGGGVGVGLFFNSQRTTLFLSKRMLAGFILGAASLPCWGLEIAL